MPYGEGVTTTPDGSPGRQPSRTAPSAGPRAVRTPPTRRRVDRLAFLHELARLATQARDWDELMRTLVERSTSALGVDVCSFYLLDRDGQRLTLAATNGLDVTQVGKISLSVGEGITGMTAEGREPLFTTDVTADERFRWVRGFDLAGLHAMLSVPLIWNEAVVGVLNVQSREVREFSPAEIELLTTIAALLAGIV